MSWRYSGVKNVGPPCPLPLTTTSVASTPAFFSAAASDWLCASGTRGSRSPCMMRKGRNPC